MANEKETKKMATPETAKIEVPQIFITSLKPKQKVLNLADGAEAEIEVISKKYEAPAYSEKYGTVEQFEKALFHEAAKLVQPVGKQIDAFLKMATAESYQAGKAEALAKGDYLTSELRGKIVQVMRGNQAFVDLSAKDCFDRWMAGYLAKKPGAYKVLDTAKALGDFGDDL